MRATILFVLIACILSLMVWMWHVNPSRYEYSLEKGLSMSQQIDKVRKTNNIDVLKEHAIDQLVQRDQLSVERDEATSRVQILLAVAIVLTGIAQVVIFLEVAARGKSDSQ